jgi:CubicO group peptidase (beta-lactamase class C family)
MSYANPGYVLAGYVLERVAGKPFADVIADSVLKPLGMNRSTFRPTTAMTYPLALGHDPTRDSATVIRPFAEHAGNWPPGSLFTNVQEYSRFLIALVNKPSLAFQTISSPKAPVVALDRQYGYGLVTMMERGVKIVEHSGARSGYGSVVWAAPDHHAAVVILTNRTGAIFFKSARKAIELLTPEANSEAPEPRRTELPMTRAEIAQYTGTYINNETIRAELVSQENKLILKLAGRAFPVHKTGPQEFSAPGSAQLEQFRLVPGPNGRSEYLAVEYWALHRLN